MDVDQIDINICIDTGQIEELGKQQYDKLATKTPTINDAENDHDEAVMARFDERMNELKVKHIAVVSDSEALMTGDDDDDEKEIVKVTRVSNDEKVDVLSENVKNEKNVNVDYDVENNNKTEQNDDDKSVE